MIWEDKKGILIENRWKADEVVKYRPMSLITEMGRLFGLKLG